MTGSISMDFTAGTSIENAARSAQNVADILNVSVGFKFNDVECWAVPHGDHQKLAQAQQDQQRRPLARPRDYRFASSR